MNWEDEHFVKLYTRDTTTWKLIGWQARTVLMHILRKVDRAGVLDLGGVSGEEAICAVADLPEEVVKPGLEKLLAKKVVTICDNALLIPNFVEAQEAKQSDKSRQRNSRAKRRAGVTPRDKKPPPHDPRDGPSQNVTPGHETGQNVTSGHVESHPVTLRLEETRLEETPPVGGGCARAHDPPDSPPPPSAASPPEGAPPKPPARPPAKALPDDERVPWRRVFGLLAQLSAGAVGDPTGCRRGCQRIVDQAQQMAGEGQPWWDTTERAIRSWHERQVERGKPVLAQYCANDFAEHWQRVTKPRAAENEAARVVREAERYARLSCLGDALTPEQRNEMGALRPSYDKYQARGQWYEERAAAS